jgi:hypothetical protein
MRPAVFSPSVYGWFTEGFNTLDLKEAKDSAWWDSRVTKRFKTAPNLLQCTRQFLAHLGRLTHAPGRQLSGNTGRDSL